jgi:hypothetical protein
MSGRVGTMKMRRMNIGSRWITVAPVPIEPRAVIKPWSGFRPIINLATAHIAVGNAAAQTESRACEKNRTEQNFEGRFHR